MRPSKNMARYLPIQTLLLRIFLPAVLLVAALLAVFAYNWHYATIIEGFDRKLVTTSALTGALIDPQDHDLLVAAARTGEDPGTTERTKEYERNAAPIRRILAALNLTYLYSQATAETSDIVYVLDGSIGDEHSPIGTPDDLTDQTMRGILNVEKDRGVFVSPIEYQEQWGLLKTAAAPIYDSKGDVSSTAGADVNISLILVATQNALFASTVIGLGSIALCLLITFAIVRKVARPIEALKDRALAVAAGDRLSSEAPSSAHNEPREVNRLSRALSQLAEKFALSAAKKERSFAEEEIKANTEWIESECESAVIHLLDCEGLNVFWAPLPKDPQRPFDYAATVLASLAMANLARRFEGADGKELAVHWRNLVDIRNGLCLCIDKENGTIEQLEGVAAAIIHEGGEIRLIPGARTAFNPRCDMIKIGNARPFLLPSKSEVRRGEP